MMVSYKNTKSVRTSTIHSLFVLQTKGQTVTRSQKVWYWVLTAFVTVALVNFGSYMFSYDRLGANFGENPNVFDLALFMLLSLTLLHIVFMFLLSWTMTGLLQKKIPTSMQNLHLPDPKTAKVAFITTFVPGSEPHEMLAQTLKAMLHADFPHDTWVLDEGNDPKVQRLCRILGVNYFTRKGIEKYNTIGGTFSAKSKGGNHNAWYDAHGTKYDFVAQIDTDFLPRRDFLTKTLAYFSNPDVAWVGTPQVYKNTESLLARGAAEQTYGFYGPIMTGLSRMESTMLIGANHVIRVEALKRAGLYYAHLTEDLATGMTLHSQGWKSYYVPEVLAEGEGPTTWGAYFKQQFRWAKGSIDLQMTQSLKLTRRMKPFQMLLYAWMLCFYWTGAAFGAGVLLLMLYFGFGWSAAQIELVPFLTAYLPMLAMCEIAMLWTQQFNVRPKKERGLFLRARLMLIAAMPVYLSAFLSAVRSLGKHTEFEVTQKGLGGGPKRKKGSKNPFHPHVIVAITVAIALVVGVILRNTSLIYIGWALLTLTPLVILSIRPKWEIIKFEVRRFTRKQRRLISELEAALTKLQDPIIPITTEAVRQQSLMEFSEHLQLVTSESTVKLTVQNT